MRRSVNVELDLEEGEYEVRVRLDTQRFEYLLPVDQVLRQNVKTRRDKMIRVGIAYDLAHSKGAIEETAEEKAAKAAKEQREKDKESEELKTKILTNREKAHYLRTKQILREQKRRQRQITKEKQKRVERKARQKEKHVNGIQEEDSKAEKTPAIAVQGETAEEDGVSIKANADDTFCESEESDDGFESPDDLSVLSERELDIQIDSYLDPSSSLARLQAPQQPSDTEEEPDEFELSPWNAVATVGLRVYHKVDESDEKPATVKLRVVRTNPYLDSDEEEVEKKQEEKTGGLDVDDSAKDATLEGGPRERRRSIVGDGKGGLL
jgi:hypothetical protein